MHLPLIKRIVCRAEQRLECALRALVAPRVHIHVMVPDSTVERHAALRSGSHHRHEKRGSIVPLPYYVTASYSDSRKARGLHQMPHVSGGLLYIPYLLRFIYLDIGPEEKHVPGLILHGGANLKIHPEDFLFLIRDIPVKTRSIVFQRNCVARRHRDIDKLRITIAFKHIPACMVSPHDTPAISHRHIWNTFP